MVLLVYRDGCGVCVVFFVLVCSVYLQSCNLLQVGNQCLLKSLDQHTTNLPVNLPDDFAQHMRCMALSMV